VIVDGAIGHKPQHGWLAQAIGGSVHNPQAILVRALVATVVLVGLSALFDFCSDYLMNGAGERVVVRIRRFSPGNGWGSSAVPARASRRS
jgi:ATP-binding cassette, subfamily B, bacterial